MTIAQGQAPVITDLTESATPAPESLRPWFTELGHIPTVRDTSIPFAHIPQAAAMIVLRTEDCGPRDALVLGPRTRASYAEADKPMGCLRLRLAPGAVGPLLGVSAGELTDRIVRLADLPGPAAQFAGELVELRRDELFPYLEQRLPQRIRESSAQISHRKLLRTAVEYVSGRAVPATVPALAGTLAVSERQLRNLFSSGIGVSPKHYNRIDRIRRVLTRLGTSPWSHLAVGAGYYDQSHLTAEFRSFMGVAPGSFLGGTRLPIQPCRPAIYVRTISSSGR
ncbi:helix-turn-helix domain-containing protein [Nocardia sp. NBC_01329]|uniref:helix-turn-helix domain-containing protein n=1 Tax=Nocardia sp. NBC_01329 TaxID=2903594 RepID=UPI002E142FE7|nr:helix-turn-helix domain-containing protein [Nocardia sp. NBC_01329]